MWNWAKSIGKGERLPARRSTRTRLRLEQLEEREVPAVAIQLDYSHDVTGFFNDPARRATLQQAADALGSQLSANLIAITPSGGNTWTETFYDPATGGQSTIYNSSLAANTIVVYAGGRSLGGGQASVGGMGGFSISGSQDWLNSVQSRGPDGNMLWGGSVSFDTSTNFYFGSAASGLGKTQIDFLTCASHELLNALGAGTSSQWFAQVSNGTFTGSHAEAIYGGPIPVTWGGGAELADVTVNGVRPVKNLDLTIGTRTAPYTPLDWALLQDIGWGVGSSAGASGTGSSSGGSSGASSTPPVSSTPATASAIPVIFTGPKSGIAQAYVSSSSGQLTPEGPSYTPFPGWAGVIRSTVGDFLGNGHTDIAFATGSGTSAQVTIFDGTTGAQLIPPTTVLGGFSGGVYIAAGNVDRSGKDILAISADAGGGTRIEISGIRNGALSDLNDFIAFGDPNFRGGARVALGDVNHDGVDDLIVGAGIGGSPRVAIYEGSSILSSSPTALVHDFYALDPTLRTGVFVTAADLDGDGYADVIYSTGTGGGPRVMAISGAVITANPGVDAYNLPSLANLFALDANNRDGLRVVARDVEGTGRADLIVASGALTNAQVRDIPIAQLESGNPTNPILYPFGNTLTADGIYVG